MKSKLRAIREQLDLTPQGLESLCGVSVSQIMELEEGIGIPKLNTAYAIAKALNKSVYDIWWEL